MCIYVLDLEGDICGMLLCFFPLFVIFAYLYHLIFTINMYYLQEKKRFCGFF